MTHQLTQTSKFLSYILRHSPDTIGLHLDANGWANIEQLIQLANQHGKKIDLALLLQVVKEDAKQRFTLSRDGQSIRAAQGHSLKNVDLQFEAVTPPEYLFHGTAKRFLDAIWQSGLQPQSRQFVHLSASFTTALEVGQRYGEPVVLKVDSREMVEQGYIFYCAENQVWLTTEVPPLFLSISEQS